LKKTGDGRPKTEDRRRKKEDGRKNGRRGEWKRMGEGETEGWRDEGMERQRDRGKVCNKDPLPGGVGVG